jgi:hypothetical protein
MWFKSRLNRHPGTVRQAYLSAGAATRHYGHGPPVSPPPLFVRPRGMAVPHCPRPPVSSRCRPGVVRRSAGTHLLSLSRPSPAAWCHPTSACRIKRLSSPPRPLLSPPFSLLFPGHTSSPDTPPPPLVHRRRPEDFSPHGISPEPHRRPPSLVSGSLSLRSPQSTALLTPLYPSSCRTSPHSSMTTGATPPPLNADAQHRLGHLTIDPPFWCAPAPSSLPGATPGSH